MTEPSVLLQLPEFVRSVRASLDGTLLGSTGEVDAESVAGVSAFLATSMAEAGEQFGLGALRWISVAGLKQSMVFALKGGAVFMGYVDPPASLAAVERALDAAPEGG